MAANTTDIRSGKPAASSSGNDQYDPSPKSSNGRVLDCYELLDLMRSEVDGGIEDYTDGMYLGNENVTYQAAQENQAAYLLDEIGCHLGSRVLDVGCGNGRILTSAVQRGAQAVGITISPQQVAVCRKKGLDARLMDWRDSGRELANQFGGIIANGSIEHFVQPEDAAAGRADEIYRLMFQRFYETLDVKCADARLATTVIHFGRRCISPEEAMMSPFHHRWGSDAFHYALLTRAFGGYYPTPGQLEKCAAPFFELAREEDGTEDYWRTSEHWLATAKRSLRQSPAFQVGLLGKLLRHPISACQMVTCLLIAQSWNWQFRGEAPPMRLLRQTWRARGH